MLADGASPVSDPLYRSCPIHTHSLFHFDFREALALSLFLLSVRARFSPL